MKIKLKKEDLEEKTNEKKRNDKDFLKIFLYVFLTILALVIIIELIIIIVYTDKISKLEDSLESIPSISAETKIIQENIEYNPSNNLIIWFS